MLFSVLGVSFYKEGTDLRHHLWVVEYWWLFWPVAFFMVTTSISENAAHLELSGLSYKTVYVLMSVCYILPEMMRNMRKIQQAQKVRGTNPQKTLIQKLKSVLPVLIHWWLRPWINRWRGRFLQLRGFDNLNRTVRTSPARVSPVGRCTLVWLDWQFYWLRVGWKINGL